MIITLRELMTWTGITIFELWTTVAALIVSSAILVLKVHSFMALTYFNVFFPLFLSAGCNFYFLFIVFVRSILEYKDYKGPVARFVFNFIRLVLLTLFVVLLCQKIEGDLDQSQVAVRSSYGIVFLPIWTLMAALAVQICRLF